MDIFEFRTRKEVRADERTEELARQVIGAAIEVHRHLGPGLPEKAYREALSHELTLQRIAHEWEVAVPIMYKGRQVAIGRIDLLVNARLVVELKVVEALGPVHQAQALSYLKAAKLQLAILINFNVALLKDGVRRVIKTI